MAFRGGKVERRSSTPLALAVRLLTSPVSQASLGGNLFVPRRFSGHSRSVFRGTRGPIANCGFFLEARRKRRGSTANHPYPGKETQNGGTTRSEHQTSEAGRQSAAKHAISCTDRSSPLSTLASSIHGWSEVAYDARQGSAGIPKTLCCGTPWLQMLELRQLQSSTVAPCAARIAEQGDNYLA